MTNAEQPAETSPLATPSFAGLRASTSATARQAARVAALACALAALAMLFVAASQASADSRISETGSAAGQTYEPQGIAVSDQQGGDVFAVSLPNQRVDQFTPAGAFVRAFGWGVADGADELQTCTAATGCQLNRNSSGEIVIGPKPGQLNFSDAIAIDNDPASPSYGDVYVLDQYKFRVQRFKFNSLTEEYEFDLMFGGGVDQGPHHPGNLCTAAYLAEGDTCGAGLPGTGPAHFYKEEPPTEAGGFKTWADPRSNSIAVGPGGTVYVGDYQRVQEFAPDGTYIGQLSLPDGNFVTALAVDSAGDIYERSATYGNQNNGALTSQVPGVREYDPSHNLIRTFATEPDASPTHIALDAAGDLFLTNLAGLQTSFRAFKPNGDLYADFTSDQVNPVVTGLGSPQSIAAFNNPGGIAIDPSTATLYASSFSRDVTDAGSIYDYHLAAIPLPTVGPPTVSAPTASDLEPTTATFHAIVNPRGFDTQARFQYVTQAHFQAEGFENAEQTPFQDLGLVIRDDSLTAAVSALEPDTVYHFRGLAESSQGTVTGPDATFTTLPAASIRNFTTQTVGPELVTIKFELDPNNSETHYLLHFGPDTTYSKGTSEATIPTGSQFVSRQVTFTGLQPDTTYHYQLIATNANGPGGHGQVTTDDATFTTELSAAESHLAEDCPNTALREQSSSQALPDCRAYEQVSPTDKAGSAAFPYLFLAPSGERVLFKSPGAFAGAEVNEYGNPYIAHRTIAGWLTRPAISRPAGPGYQPTWIRALSPELDRWIFPEGPASNGEELLYGGVPVTLYLGTDSAAVKASPPLSILDPFLKGGLINPRFDLLPVLYSLPSAAADDLSRLYIDTPYRLIPEDPRPNDESTAFVHPLRIYEVSGIGGPDPAIRFVVGVSAGFTSASCYLDDDGAIHRKPLRLTSADGSTLFYTIPIEKFPGSPCGEGAPNPIGLFARTAPDPAAPPTTVRLNATNTSHCTAPHICDGSDPKTPTYIGTSPDGRLAWFTTAQPLVDSDSDTTADLYLARLGVDGHLSDLLQASAAVAAPGHPTPGQGAGLDGVVAVSGDGTHVAYVASGVLDAASNSLGDSAASGADNLYLYDAGTGLTKFVARLCSGPGLSGAVADPACPASLAAPADKGLWGSSVSPLAQFTPDGRYLLLPSLARLTPDDTDSARDLYRYDFDAADLLRVSIGHRGNDGDGNDDAFPAEIGQIANSTQLGGPAYGPFESAGDQIRAITSDGSTVVFFTPAPLVSTDTNAGAHPGCSPELTGCDVYEWTQAGRRDCHEAAGCLSLLSDGVSPHGSQPAVISSSGRDVLIATPGGLTPADTDGVGDVYDARIDGGFPYTPPKIPCGGGETCLGPVSPPPPPPKISEGETGGNGSQQLQCAKGKVRIKKHGQVRCVAKKNHKAKKHHKRAAGRNPGGQK